MPFETPPGQVLSSVPPSSNKRRSSKIGGCAGVLFQIFHGKRLFPRKSLPAERPKHAPINHTDDKLPIAKLLLIADENRGGASKNTEEDLEEEILENVPTDEPYEEALAKRTPGVVARLMGLDSMPSLEPVFGERKQFEAQRMDTDCLFASDMPNESPVQLEKPWKTSARVQPYTSLHMARRRESKTSLPDKHTAQQKASIGKDTAKDDVAKSKILTKSPSLPPHHLDASFPSSKKSDSINRSSMRVQKTTQLLEAAARMLDASTYRTNQTRKQRLESSTSKSKIGTLDVAKNQQVQSGREQACKELKSQIIPQLTTTAVQVASNMQEETKARVGSRNASSETMSRRQKACGAPVPELHRPQAGSVGPEQVLGGGRGTLREAAPVKRKQGYQPSCTQTKANLLEKVKPDLRRQEETSRRLSQPINVNSKIQKLKPQGAIRMRHPSPPKSSQGSSGGPCSSQASNSPLPPSESICSSQPIISRVSSSITPPSRLSSSSMKGISAERGDAFNGVEVGWPLQAVCSKTAGLPNENLSTLQNPSISVSSQFGEADNSSYSHDGSISSAMYTESHQRSSMESLLSSDPSLSEFNSSSEDCPSFFVGAETTGHERLEGKWEGHKRSLNVPKRASEIFLSEDSSQSKLESISSDLGDTASSHTLSDADTRGRDSVPTYSGKNTAAILQELLTALSSSTTSKETIKKSTVVCMESCSLDSDSEQLGKARVLPGGNSLYSQDFQDSGSCNSLDSSEISQSSKPCESKSFLEGMDCTSIDETEADEDISANMEDTAQMHEDHGVSPSRKDFVDCEALMSTLSKLHHIDPEAIGLNMRAAKRYSEDNDVAEIALTGVFSGGLINSKLFNKLEEQVQQLDWGLSNSSTLSVEDDADSVYRSDIESSFRNGYEEAAAQNKKLVTDCINEALKGLSTQLYGVSSSISGRSSASQVLSRVYKQIDEWRGMAISMNLDDMIEKEMNSTTRKWRNIGTEAEEVAEVVESTILSRLMEEVLLELI